MRQSEREARIQGLASKLFGVAGEVLTVGTGSAAGQPALGWRAERRYQAALWRLSSDTASLRLGLAIVRSALLPGAAVLLVAPKRASLVAQLKAIFGGERAPRARLEPLCDALLLSGFLAPRVHDLVPGWLLVSAVLAPASDPLDAFFEQPSPPPSR
ncbi:MAG: hypothetical protein JWN04_4838 [Myxococcaceae bacterium]|nr:hypothetical protein [Myxococcaceae bacterium]